MTTQPITLAPSSEPVDKPILVGLLGPLHVLGEPGPTARMVRRTLAVLAMRAGEQVSVSELSWELWAGEHPRAALQSVQTYLMFIRRIPGLTVETTPRGYRLKASPFEIDALRFGIFTSQARAEFQDGRLLAAQDTLRAAFSLWRGPALGEVDCGPLLTSTAAEIADRHSAALDLGWDIALRQGRQQEVVDALAAAVRTSPGREDTAAKLMLAQYRCNRRADALATYASVRKWLVEELGLEPCPALQRLQAAILAGDPALELNGEQ